ncbi:MAG: 1-acyl-sn-glycerol-3-phosphate acyltransferase [Ignavibacteriales bacterium]|nr:1-acyl-sn-glycerol-3-phosphate acyltransferase [Ignavibacteriales bacterium]
MITLFKGFLVLLVAIPYSILALVSIPLDRSGKTYHMCARQWSKFILWIFGVRVSVKGLEHIGKGSVIYASNHASWFDIPAAVAGIPDDIRIMLKRELTYVPIWGWALRYGPYIAVDRTSPKDALRSLDKAAEQIRSGASVLLFVEGTRTRDGKLQAFKRGAFVLALKSGVPVVPVTINHSFRILPKGSLKIRPTDIEIIIDRPIETSAFAGRDGEAALMKEVRSTIERNLVEPGGLEV